MTEFGQNNPSVPNIYWNQASFEFTKTGFVSHMVRALTTAGMVPLTQWWPYDALDTNNAEIVRTADSSFFSTDIFAFDFPDSSTFTINDATGTPQTWRPFICVVAYYGSFASTSDPGNQTGYFRIESGIRSSGATSLNDTRGRWRQFTATNNGWGNHNNNPGVSGAGALGDLSRGMWIAKHDWKPYASYAGAGDVSTLNVRNIFVYLGPAGLFVYVGTGQTRDSFGSYLAAGFAFGGARLPGRALAVDPNLNRINPLVNLAMRETETEMNVVGESWRVVLQGMQHDQISTFTAAANNDWVWSDLWNLENAEIPFYPTRRVYTVPSPRRLSTGQGAHILGRPVYIPKELFSNAAILFGPTLPQVSSNDTRPTFAEVFTCPRLRFADITAPLGDYQEPTTLENWRIVPWPTSVNPLGSLIALYSENAFTRSTLTVGSRTLIAQRDYVFSGQTTATGSTAFPVGSPVTLASNPAGVSASAVHGTIPAGAGTARWQLSALTNESPAQAAVLYVNSSTYSTSAPNGMTGFTTGPTALNLQLSITPDVSDPVDSLYELVFTIRVRAGTQDQHNFSIAAQLNGSTYVLPMYDTVAAVTRTSIATAGASTGHYAYNYRTYTASVIRDPFVTGSPIVLNLQANRTADTNDATTIEINALTLRRYRYI